MYINHNKAYLLKLITMDWHELKLNDAGIEADITMVLEVAWVM